MKIRCGLLVVLSALGLRCGGSPEAPRYNLLLISVDTLRADRLGCYGYARDTSPSVDGLAAEGVLFENAFSSSPKTTPSHMSIMTGLYPRAHNVYMWKRGPDGVYGGKTLSAQVPTLAEILAARGYVSAAFTGGGNVAGKIGFDRGFSVYDESGDTPGACAWIARNAGKPFFLFYHTYYTHDPYLPPPPYDQRYDPEYAGGIVSGAALLSELGLRVGGAWAGGAWDKLSERFWKTVDAGDPRDIRHLNALYDGSIAYVDHEFIAALLASLRAAGVLDRTLIVFTSDHGEEFLEHGRFRHDSLYREVTRVPLILRLPGVLPAGKRVGQLVRSVDLLPTVLDILGLPLPSSVQGVSLLPAVRRDRDLGLEVYADFDDFAPPFIESVRTREWFYLMDQRDYLTREGKKRAPGFHWLFDAGRDPGEIADLSLSRPAAVARLQMRLRGLRIESSRLHFERAAEQKATTMDAENLKRLKALGYL